MFLDHKVRALPQDSFTGSGYTWIVLIPGKPGSALTKLVYLVKAPPADNRSDSGTGSAVRGQPPE